MNKYDTNILKLTCSCPDWQETRMQYPLNDPRRLCKHIINLLNVDDLPHSINKFKESIKFYQEKEWGFKRDFDELIEVDEFTLLYNFSWIDVFDQDGIKYSVKKDNFSNNIYWGKNLKPKKYNLIEDYLIKESKKIPLLLEKEEYPQIIKFIKDVLPHKKDFYISIHLSQFVPTSDGVLYNISESKLTPEKEEKLKQELLKQYNEEEVYYKLDEANLTPFGNEHEFCIYEALRVTNDEIIVGMYSGEKFKFKRDYNNAKSLKEKRELKEREEKKAQEKVWQEELDKKRKIAKDKGVTLTEDYKGDLYRIQNFYNFPECSSWDSLIKSRDYALKDYDTLDNLIKNNLIDISSIMFNKTLVELGFLIKDSALNLNNWILKDKGLEFGINYIKESKYMHENIPHWYKTHIFNFETLKLTSFDFYENIKMTKVLFKKEKFKNLNDLINDYIKNKPKKTKIKKLKSPSQKQLEREKWLRHVNCPKCGEDTNIHKKDKRKRTTGYIQRFYCNECHSMFQMDLQKLENLIQEYEENTINNEKLINLRKVVEVQSIKEEVRPTKTPQNEEQEPIKEEKKESNILKKIFSFFK